MSSYVNWVVWYVFFFFLSCLGNTVSDRGTVLMGFSCWREHCKKRMRKFVDCGVCGFRKIRSDRLFRSFFSVNFYLNIYVKYMCILIKFDRYAID